MQFYQDGNVSVRMVSTLALFPGTEQKRLQETHQKHMLLEKKR